MSTKAEWKSNKLGFFESTTHERVMRLAPVQFYEEFLGAYTTIPAGGAAESGCLWAHKQVLTGGTPVTAIKGDEVNGVCQCALDATSEEQEAIVYMDDNRQFSIEQGLIFETRVKIAVLPTLTAEAVFGLCGDYAKGPDNVTYSLFFTADGSGEVFCEADDNASDQSATSGVTATAAQTKIYRIDARDVTDIRFYIDGAHVASSTTFVYAATGANAILQPYFGLYKASGAGLGTIEVDYIRIWQDRA